MSLPSLEKVSAPAAPRLGSGVSAFALDSLDHLLGASALPGVEQLVEQRPAGHRSKTVWMEVQG
jgi:hypothetical protein